MDRKKPEKFGYNTPKCSNAKMYAIETDDNYYCKSSEKFRQNIYKIE